MIIHPERVIATRITAAGLNQTKVAKLVRMEQSTLSKRLKDTAGFQMFRFDELAAISKAVGGFSINDLRDMGLTVRKEEI